MRMSDWSSDVCSSDLSSRVDASAFRRCRRKAPARWRPPRRQLESKVWSTSPPSVPRRTPPLPMPAARPRAKPPFGPPFRRSEEHTYELQSIMRISYAVFCSTKKTQIPAKHTTPHHLQLQHTYYDFIILNKH